MRRESPKRLNPEIWKRAMSKAKRVYKSPSAYSVKVYKQLGGVDTLERKAPKKDYLDGFRKSGLVTSIKETYIDLQKGRQENLLRRGKN